MKIVQIGACQGNDHVTNLVKNSNIEFLLLVEANPFNIENLKKCYIDYPHIIENIAVTSNIVTDSISFYYSVTDGPRYEVSSIKKSHTSNYCEEKALREIKIPAISLNLLLDKYNIKYLDYLFLDIEGIDAEVALSLDLKKYNIKHIQIEFLHLGDQHQNVINYFKNFGYNLHPGIDLHGYDRLFIKN